MKKRVQRSAALALICALVLSGCGGSKAQNAASTEASVEAVVVEPDTPANPIPEEPEPEEPQHTYADVLPDSPLFEAIESAADKGLLEGFTSDNNFRPDDNLSNADMALLFYNFAGRPELDKEAEALQIANLDEANEEQALAIRWYHTAFAGYGFTTEGEETNFLAPDDVARDTDFTNTVFLTTEQLTGESPLNGQFTEFRDPEGSPAKEVTRGHAVEVLDEVSETFPVGTEFTEELSEEILAKINPPAEQLTAPQQTEVAVNPTPTPAPATTPQPEATPTPTPAPTPEPTPAPAGDMTNPQWVWEQVAPTATAYGFTGYLNFTGGYTSIALAPVSLERQVFAIDINYQGNGYWVVVVIFDPFFGDNVTISANSIAEINNCIATYAY